MSLTRKPMLAEAALRRGPRPFADKIYPGLVLAWEPDEPIARELIVVTRIVGDRVWSRPIMGEDECSNDESRFREAVVATCIRDMPVKLDRLPVSMLMAGLRR